ncbi:MAG: hypothetical protein A3E88_06940 [Legionellales bacterium RIFCSPHIGHO2_12_FULL_35_11]|nr:MAG: hypothetical protein A3E88_06940 [Legionellales bacterium RIFCSPHIGHO2_12_FULL_35_11]
MIKLLKYILLFFIFSSPVSAVTCYITIVKASCWNNYNLEVTVRDANTLKKIADVNVYQSSLWIRQEFPCQPGLTLSLEATFNPVFWSSDDGRVFKATKFWKLPDTATGNTIGWNLTVCFPEWFSDVPIPPEDSGKCVCDISKIPEMQSGDEEKEQTKPK